MTRNAKLEFADGDYVSELAVRWAKEYGSRLAGIGVVDGPATRQPEKIREPDIELAWMEGHWKDEREKVEKQFRLRRAFIVITPLPSLAPPN